MQPATVSGTSPHRGAIATDATRTPSLPFVNSEPTLEGLTHRLTLAVQGIHCARCIWAIESALNDLPQVTQARVNMSTARLVVTWQGDAAFAETVVHTVEALGYRLTPIEEQKKAQHTEDQFLIRCMAVAAFAMGNIMLLSVALWSSNQQIMGLMTREMFHLISGAIAVPTVIYAGRPFFSSAWSVLRTGRTNMDVPISLAIVLATGMSIIETLHRREHAYFDSAVMLLFFLLVGRWLDSRARAKARQSAAGLLAMMQGTATLVQDGRLSTIAIKELSEGMVVQVAAGEKVPTDAVVEQGTSELDTSLITGETMPVNVQPGSLLYGGTINLSAPLICRVSKASQESLLADIVRLMEQAEQGRARYVRLADRAARLYTPVVHFLALITFLGWYVGAHLAWQPALMIAVTTLIITCPCALGLAVPVVQVLASGWLMRRGVLLKSGDALERLAAIDTVCFDKTGTLTRGEPMLVDRPQNETLFALAASLASHSRHPLAVALHAAWQGDVLPALEEIEEVAGSGMQACYQGQTLKLGRASWCCLEVTAEQKDDTGVLQELWCLLDAGPAQRFTFSDALREDAALATQTLMQNGLDVHLLSGDRQVVAQHVASQLGIGHVHAPCLPAEKVAIISTLKKQGRHVLMVGDGLNDAPALSAASVSMSPSSGVDMAQNAADMVFQGKGLMAVVQSWRMARFSTRLVKQNFALAILYNLFAVPMAMLGHVTPMAAAIAMSSSSLIVILNSFRINRLKG